MALSGASSNFGVTRRTDLAGIISLTVDNDLNNCTTISNITNSAIGIECPADVKSTTLLTVYGSFSESTGFQIITKADDDAAALQVKVANSVMVPLPAHRTFPFPYIRLLRADGSADWTARGIVKA